MAAVVLGGCARGPTVDPHAPGSRSVAASPSSVAGPPSSVAGPPSSAAGCAGAPVATRVVHLGGDGNETMPGNGSPVTVSVPVASIVEVDIVFGQRHLLLPTIEPPAHDVITPGGDVLSAICTERSGYEVRAVFRADSDGTRVVMSRTDDCGACAALVFTATIVVTPAPAQKEPLTGGASSTSPPAGCAGAPTPAQVVHMGTHQPMSLRVPVGSIIAFTAGPGLTAPAVEPPGRTAVTPSDFVLSRICEDRTAGGTTVEFRADSHGDAYVSTSRTGCPGCMQSNGPVTVTVLSVPGQEEPLTGGGSS